MALDGRRGLGKAVALVFALAVLLRLGLLASVWDRPAKLYEPDSNGYEAIAVNLIRHGVFSAHPAPPHRPNFTRTPGYPAFLAGVYALRGGPAPVAAACVQGLLGSLAAVLTLVLAAGALGAATLTRPIAQFLPPALLLLFPLARARVGSRRLVAAAVLLLAVASGLAATWAIRNYRLAGTFSLSGVSVYSLTEVRAREVLARAEGIDLDEARRRIDAGIGARGGGGPVGLAERRRRVWQEGVAILLRYPTAAAATTLTGAGRLLGDPGFTLACSLLDPGPRAVKCFPDDAAQNRPGVLGRTLSRLGAMRPAQQLTLLASALWLALVYAGSAVGATRLARGRRWLALGLLTLPIAYFLALSPGAEANSRFRMPVVPFLAVLPAAGLAPQVGAGPARPLSRSSAV